MTLDRKKGKEIINLGFFKEKRYSNPRVGGKLQKNTPKIGFQTLRRQALRRAQQTE